MAWKCPTCGFDVNEDGQTDCAGGCGFVRFPARLVLAAGTAGQKLSMGLSTSVGRRLLEPLVGADARFASEVQFQILRLDAQGVWAVQHAPAATNPTFLNGVPLSGPPAALENGAVLSIGLEKARLTVQMED